MNMGIKGVHVDLLFKLMTQPYGLTVVLSFIRFHSVFKTTMKKISKNGLKTIRNLMIEEQSNTNQNIYGHGQKEQTEW